MTCEECLAWMEFRSNLALVLWAIVIAILFYGVFTLVRSSRRLKHQRELCKLKRLGYQKPDENRHKDGCCD